MGYANLQKKIACTSQHNEHFTSNKEDGTIFFEPTNPLAQIPPPRCGSARAWGEVSPANVGGIHQCIQRPHQYGRFRVT